MVGAGEKCSWVVSGRMATRVVSVDPPQHFAVVEVQYQPPYPTIPTHALRKHHTLTPLPKSSARQPADTIFVVHKL